MSSRNDIFINSIYSKISNKITMFNIVIVSAIFWSYIIKIFIIKKISEFEWYWFNTLYFIGFFIIIGGTVIFLLNVRVKRNEFSYA